MMPTTTLSVRRLLGGGFILILYKGFCALFYLLRSRIFVKTMFSTFRTALAKYLDYLHCVGCVGGANHSPLSGKMFPIVRQQHYCW